MPPCAAEFFIIVSTGYFIQIPLLHEVAVSGGTMLIICMQAALCPHHFLPECGGHGRLEQGGQGREGEGIGQSKPKQKTETLNRKTTTSASVKETFVLSSLVLLVGGTTVASMFDTGPSVCRLAVKVPVLHGPIVVRSQSSQPERIRGSFQLHILKSAAKLMVCRKGTLRLDLD
ncbi:hypothetical protein VOLCADRAFT_93758 [Volvox carteri f. nagariensis]|uniref:Uncharacterized protein n=1 Tax=Volvox carteri f. nagariensis TaxID=3068 RepID=D8U2Z4_VOLCA|nr:uncharacterized protein VOLCADRAFT_93758 [Volvox carteri f. nagariensis]EFJ45891.1 hypothetical protein VOLCADRAFT_93758 [Volvox carteri f. nagariensis]|eukprot:XP_002952969.1 hypothetical protein VOLCADRAFT_93758 [Volvox carteri f. nagariensis]